MPSTMVCINLSRILFTAAVSFIVEVEAYRFNCRPTGFLYPSWPTYFFIQEAPGTICKKRWQMGRLVLKRCLSRSRKPEGEDSAKRIRPEPSSFRESALLHKLLELVGNGGSHVATATEIARAAEIDFPHPLPDGLKKLASCGAHGACASNTERDFRRWTRGAYGFRLEPYPIKLTLEVPGECLPQEHDASVRAGVNKTIADLCAWSLHYEDGEMQLLNVCAFSLAKAIELIDNSGLILSSEEASEITKFLLMHLRTTRRLASICWGNAIMAFKMRPKHHYLWHIAMDVTATKLNPRLFHVWEDEKFLGRIKRIATKCHGGTVQRRALERYVLALSNYMSSLA
ncbi:unnamed protein product [Durusdinium trenchii]|uniref:Uncharacterized protein n=1 Tax=Durusdinium trenchii TaxID=1381693 RepID=A0ABP0T1D5_9DINO